MSAFNHARFNDIPPTVFLEEDWEIVRLYIRISVIVVQGQQLTKLRSQFELKTISFCCYS